MNFVSIKARIAEDYRDDRRALERTKVRLDVTMRELGSNGIDAQVLNISERGFMATTDTRFEVGARVWLMIPGRTRANAVIKWTAGDKIGAEFAEPQAIAELGD